MKAVIAIIIVLIVGGGVSVAANNSLPGDALHGIKVGVNERMRLGMSVSAQSQANTRAEIAEERLMEAERLAVDDRMNARARTQVETNFTEHADRIRALIADLEDTDLMAAAEIASNLETSLKAHEVILAQVEAGMDDQAQMNEIAALRVRVGEEARSFERLRMDLEARLKAQADVRAAAEGRITAATNKIAEVRRFIASVTSRLSAEAVARAEARLSVADATLAQARARLAAEAFGEAFMLASEAHRIAQDAQIMAASQLRLRIQIGVPGAATGTGATVNVNAGIRANVNAGVNVNVNTNANRNGNLNLNVNVNLP